MNNPISFMTVFRRQPQAIAGIRGSDGYPNLSGLVRFYQTQYGVVVAAELAGLPETGETCRSPVFAFHIHSGRRCAGPSDDPFSAALTHYNPHDCPHPYHAGDLPPLFGSHGYAFSVFLTDRFAVGDILGRTIIIHAELDDFTTQPGGNAGSRIACGEIRRV